MARSLHLSTLVPADLVLVDAKIKDARVSPFSVNRDDLGDSLWRGNARIRVSGQIGRRMMSRGSSFDLRERLIGLVEGGMSRRAAARHLRISASSSIKGRQRFEATGSFAEKPRKELRPSPLDDPAEGLLAVVAVESVLTLAEIEARLLVERQFKTADSSISRFFQRHGISDKKTLHASEQHCRRRGQGARGMGKRATGT